MVLNMQLGLTIPLQKFLKAPKPPYGDSIDPFFCWEIHKVPDMPRSTFVAVNASNRFSLVFMGMKAASWKRLPEIIIESMELAFGLEGYTPQQVETYLAAAGSPEFTKTHGRKPVAGMNRAVDLLYWIELHMDQSMLYQPMISRVLNEDLCRAAGFPDVDYGYPWEYFRQDMQRIGIHAEDDESVWHNVPALLHL